MMAHDRNQKAIFFLGQQTRKLYSSPFHSICKTRSPLEASQIWNSGLASRHGAFFWIWTLSLQKFIHSILYVKVCLSNKGFLSDTRARHFGSDKPGTSDFLGWFNCFRGVMLHSKPSHGFWSAPCHHGKNLGILCSGFPSKIKFQNRGHSRLVQQSHRGYWYVWTPNRQHQLPCIFRGKLGHWLRNGQGKWYMLYVLYE